MQNHIALVGKLLCDCMWLALYITDRPPVACGYFVHMANNKATSGGSVSLRGSTVQIVVAGAEALLQCGHIIGDQLRQSMHYWGSPL